jgi:hypothetical protein
MSVASTNGFVRKTGAQYARHHKMIDDFSVLSLGDHSIFVNILWIYYSYSVLCFTQLAE